MAFNALTAKGIWNAATNNLALIPGRGENGDCYVVSVAGATALGQAGTWAAGDLCYFALDRWIRIPASIAVVPVAVDEVEDIALAAVTGAVEEAVADIDVSGRQSLMRKNAGILRAMSDAANGVATSPAVEAVMVSPPTVTTATGSLSVIPTVVSGGAYLRYDLDGDAFPMECGWRAPVSGLWLRAAHGAASASNLRTVVSRFPFTCDSRYAAFYVIGSATPYLIEVDGKYTTKSGHLTQTTSGHNWLILDFGTKAVRNVSIHADASTGVGACYVESGSTVAARAHTGLFNKRLALMCDSFGYGSGATLKPLGLSAQIADLLGFRDFVSASNPGTGYLDTGSGSLTFRQHIEDITDEDLSFRIAEGAPGLTNPDCLIIGGGINDIGESAAAITAEAILLYQGLTRLRPDMPIIVLGPWDTAAPAAPSAGYVTTRNAVETACAGFPTIAFVDIEGISFSQVAGHPDNAGHITLTAGLLPLIRAAFTTLINR